MHLSVIIPTRNRAPALAVLLESLGNQRPVPFDWEVVVVDNGSTDTTAEVVQRQQATLPITLRCVYEPEPGLHQGRHRGAREARGDVLAYLDDDTIVVRDWVRGNELIAQGRAEAVVGRILPFWGARPPDWVGSLWHWMPQGTGRCMGYLSLLDLGPEVRPVEPGYVYGCNCFIRKVTLEQLGGFHPDGMPRELLRFRGDGETGLMRKFKQQGLRSFYDPRATVLHVIDAHRLTVSYMEQRAYNQGISNSFTVLRAAHGLPGSPAPSPRNLYHRLRGKTPVEVGQAIVRRGRELLKRLVGNLAPNDLYPDLRTRIAAAYQEGYDFHQREVQNDPDLLAYVLRESYLD